MPTQKQLTSLAALEDQVRFQQTLLKTNKQQRQTTRAMICWYSEDIAGKEKKKMRETKWEKLKKCVHLLAC